MGGLQGGKKLKTKIEQKRKGNLEYNYIKEFISTRHIVQNLHTITKRHLYKQENTVRHKSF